MTVTRYIASTVVEYTDERGQKQSRWYEIGAAWPTKSGDGINIVLHAMPVNGKISLFPPKDNPHDGI